MKKTNEISYNITEDQIRYIQEHTFNMLYEDTMYWLFTERMAMYLPFLQKKKESLISLQELLTYCKNHYIEVYPMPFKKGKLRTAIASYIESYKMYRDGLLIKSNKVARLIVEYSKFCLANFPAV